eukprot:4930881-Pyramimonas_sp.AAC.1
MIQGPPQQTKRPKSAAPVAETPPPCGQCCGQSPRQRGRCKLGALRRGPLPGGHGTNPRQKG